MGLIDISTCTDWLRLETLVQTLDFSKDIHYFKKCFEVTDDSRVVLMASVGGQDVGLCVVNFAPTYPPFKRLGIPEIQDLNVHPDARGQGVGAALVRAAEDVARARGAADMGIGVGLTAAYGPAQRLYGKLGYIPDGAGISEDGMPIRPGDMRAMGDDVCLFMVKEL